MARKSLLEQANEKADALIGIASALPIFRLVHLLNQHSMLELVCEDDFPVYIEKSKKVFDFPFYYYENEDYRSSFCLVNNSNRETYLLPLHKQLSYLLIIKGAMPTDKISKLVSSIKSIPGIQLATLLNQSGIKSFDSIMEDLEMHLNTLKIKRTSLEKRIMPSAEDQ